MAATSIIALNECQVDKEIKSGDASQGSKTWPGVGAYATRGDGQGGMNMVEPKLTPEVRPPILQTHRNPCSSSIRS